MQKLRSEMIQKLLIWRKMAKKYGDSSGTAAFSSVFLVGQFNSKNKIPFGIWHFLPLLAELDIPESFKTNLLVAKLHYKYKCLFVNYV